MSTLRQFLDSVLSGRDTVKSRGQLELLRRIANISELEMLASIEEQFCEAERKHRTQAVAILTKADAERIVTQPDTASVQELQEILARATELRLSAWQIESIRTSLASQLAQLYRGDSRPSELKKLGFMETPYGAIDQFTALGFERLKWAGMRAIDDCANHVVRGCPCYAPTREVLWRVRMQFAEKSPEHFISAQVLDMLEDHGHLKTFNPRIAEQ